MTVFPCDVQYIHVSYVFLYISSVAWITARQASLSITNSWSLLKLMPIELVMPSSHLSLYILVPFLYIASATFPLPIGIHSFVFYICDSILHTHSFNFGIPWWLRLYRICLHAGDFLDSTFNW